MRRCADSSSYFVYSVILPSNEHSRCPPSTSHLHDSQCLRGHAPHLVNVAPLQFSSCFSPRHVCGHAFSHVSGSLLESEVLDILVVDLQCLRVELQHTQYHNLGCKVFWRLTWKGRSCAVKVFIWGPCHTRGRGTTSSNMAPCPRKVFFSLFFSLYCGTSGH